MRKYGDVITFPFNGGYVTAMVILAAGTITTDFFHVTDEGTSISNEFGSPRVMVLGLKYEANPSDYHQVAKTATHYGTYEVIKE